MIATASAVHVILSPNCTTAWSQPLVVELPEPAEPIEMPTEPFEVVVPKMPRRRDLAYEWL